MKCKLNMNEDLFNYYPSKNKFHIRCKRCESRVVSDRRLKNKMRCIEYKGSKCFACGYDKCIDALEFHHTDPSKKSRSWHKSITDRKFEIIKDELDTCILLCANCHREEHYNENRLP